MDNIYSHDNFSAFIKSNEGIIFKIARVYCPDSENRKDLVQEILVQLWKSRKKYDNSFKISTWVYRISLNVAISFYRKQLVRESKKSPFHENLEHETDHQDIGDKEKNIQLLYRFIYELNELDRALMLLYLEEKSHQEIAEILGISQSNVGTRVSRIKQQLKQRFETVKGI